MKKIVFVGGGIVSCISALKLLEKGHNVEIYERHSKLGGILQDFNNGNQIFLRGCKYIIFENNWANKFYKDLLQSLFVLNVNYGVYVENNKNNIFSEEYAIPLFNNINIKKINQNLKKFNFNNIETVSDRLNFYPDKIKIFLKNIILKHKLKPSELNQISLGSFAMTRIASIKNSEIIYKLKKKSNVIDNLFAINRSRLFKKKLKALLPKNGYDELFSNIKFKLCNKGAKIILNSQLNLNWKESQLKLFNQGVEVKNDLIIWTGDPTNVVKSFNGKNLESHHYKVVQFNSNISNSKNFKTIYIQVFSENSNIIRINLYKINNIEKVSIETIFQGYKNSDIVYDEALKILKKFNIHLVLDISSFSKNLDLRYNIISKNDFKILKEFSYKVRNSNILSKFMLKQGINNKINSVFSDLKKRNYF